MIQSIRKSKITKVIASYLAIQLVLQITQPMQIWALTSGPSQPEFNSFTPIGTSDMVNLSTGDFNYNIPIMDVGGYPLNLSYDSGITMDQEASWVGLGWNLNVGQINRQVRGIPDDFKGDKMRYQNNMKNNVTVGVSAAFDAQLFGFEQQDGVWVPKEGETSGKARFGVNLKYNNYTGISFTPSYGISFDLANAVNVGVNAETSAVDGVSINPSIGASFKNDKDKKSAVTGGLNAGLSYNSNRGLSTLNLSGSMGVQAKNKDSKKYTARGNTSGSGSISFDHLTLTPRKRTAFVNYNGTVAVSFGASIWGLDGEAEISAMGAVQKIKDPTKEEEAYGYEYTGFASNEDILDYNRENDRPISKLTLSLPVTNYTYDLYSVQAQGTGGMFRPFRSQIGHIRDELVEDRSESISLGVEIEAASSVHAGVNFTTAPSKSRTGLWDTKALKYFKQKREDQRQNGEALDYEPVYFKYIGESKVDRNQDMYENLGGKSPIALKINNNLKFNKYAENTFKKKVYDAQGKPSYEDISFSSPFKKNRELRSRTIQKLSVADVRALYSPVYADKRINKYAKESQHHTAEIRLMNSDGATYVFGETAYNTNKKEVTFSTDSNNTNALDGTVTFSVRENTLSNSSGLDHFYNNVETPGYAHTYLLSSVFSSDYEDLTSDGPTDDDLGSYTNFEYVQYNANGGIIEEGQNAELYKWKIPYGNMQASYNAGLNTDKADQKGSYVYGEKEIKYLRKIETKTHVALFDLSARKDGRGVDNEQGGNQRNSGGYQYKIDKIRLYSKPEYLAHQTLLEDNNITNDPVTPIKTAHFNYEYSLCKNLPSNDRTTAKGTELSNEGGKLTLKKVYFTYRKSNMGKYTPYIFNYDSYNPSYKLKAHNIWGTYKEPEGGFATSDPLTIAEFPYVNQEDRFLEDRNASAWSMTSINLPSGGKIELTYESDDYQYVQDKPSMQMFKVVGAGKDRILNLASPIETQSTYHKLYKATDNGDADYLYIHLPNETTSNIDVKEKYLKGILKKPIYFRFLMNMTKGGALSTNNNDYDYVTGYFQIEDAKEVGVFTNNGKVYASIPMKRVKMEGGINGNRDVNPISKAGWYFGRKYLNGIVYGLNTNYKTENIETIAKKIIANTAALKDIISGPNAKLRSNEFLCAQRFYPGKAWIRLNTPNKTKIGGGLRVKELKMKDEWGSMLVPNYSNDTRYNKQYGQIYEYDLEDGTTSGVSTFEPSESKENPFVEPFYDKHKRLIAPRESNYVEKPFGKSFFPNSKITYSQVTVKNLTKEGVKKHATGKVVNKFYTTKDYPTKVDYTDLDSPSNFATNQNAFLKNLIKGIFGARVEMKNEFTLSQGFVVHTNDMDGKIKSQEVYGEKIDATQEKETLISSVEYKYSTSVDDDTELNNKLPVIDRTGTVHFDKEIGVDYDVVTDFRESYNESKTLGIKANVVTLFVGIFPVIVPTAIPSRTRIENIAHSTITTKVIHTTAILKEKIATDLGSKVSTTNEAWDAETGQIILTKTINEFDDQYYNFNYPAHWVYKQMGSASKNIGITGILRRNGQFFTIPNAKEYFIPGDELLVKYDDQIRKFWVAKIDEVNNGLVLMDAQGVVVNKSGSNGLIINSDLQFKIIRSGYRNQQGANMASVTMMKNPIVRNNNALTYQLNSHNFIQGNSAIANNLRIINASAVEYEDFWNCQCESQLPFVPYRGDLSAELLSDAIEDYGFNPFLYNVKGEWKAKKSYAYLTERTLLENTTLDKVNTRNQGFFKQFQPYYIVTNGAWVKNNQASDKWTFASEVTQYTPYGAELENKDALDRYSSAQYGYNYTLSTLR